MTQTILPPNATAIEKGLDLVVAVRIDGINVPIEEVVNPWTCPEPFLPFLAWAHSVDVWDPDWPVEVKRQVIASSYTVHRTKGTPGAIELGLGAMDFEAVVIEWWEAGITKGRFRVEVDIATRGLTERELDTIHAGIRAYKNAKSHLDQLTVRLATQGGMHVGAAPQLGVDLTVLPLLPEDPDIDGTAFVAGAINYGLTLTVYPEA